MMAKKHILPPTLTQVTGFSKLIALFLVLLFPFAGFYIGMNYQRLQDTQKEAAIFVTPTTMPTLVQGEGLTLTNADNNKTYHVKKGTRILVSLQSDSVKWSIASSDQNILGIAPLNIMAIRGTTAMKYAALHSGTATIRATGSPICELHRPCPQFLMRYSVTIVVE